MDQPNNNTLKKILVVEDEVYLRQLYVKILTDAGYSVDQATDGEEALAAISKGGYDLILLDIILPKIDGLKILERINASPPEIPNKAIVILSNLSQDSVVARGLEMGVRGYIVKSDYTPEQLLKEVQTYL